jgi:MFS transporter, DHA1 family, multidrug resistance protein
VADRYGRKLMIERAMFGGAVVLAMMGFAQNVWQLAALRAVQGALTGTVTAAMTLVASSTPRERSGYALGSLQTAAWIGASVGPLLGGFLADAWGYRVTFWVTASLLFLAGLIVWRFVQENRPTSSSSKIEVRAGFWEGLRLVVCSGPLVSLFGIELLIRLATRLLNPVLPLIVQSLVTSTARVASLTGLISGVSAATTAIGAVTFGRASDRIGYRRVLVTCAAIAAVLYIPQFFVTHPWQLTVLQALVGLVIGGAVASMSAMLANLAPEGRQGAVYGVDSSVLSMANAMGPLLAAGGAVVLGLRIPFLLAAGGFALAAALGWFLMPRH